MVKLSKNYLKKLIVLRNFPLPFFVSVCLVRFSQKSMPTYFLHSKIQLTKCARDRGPCHLTPFRGRRYLFFPSGLHRFSEHLLFLCSVQPLPVLHFEIIMKTRDRRKLLRSSPEFLLRNSIKTKERSPESKNDRC